jgi:uncharacterized protein (DUF2267 family)
MTTGIQAIDTSLQKTQLWLREIQAAMGWENRERAYSGLRAVLHALRDRLTLDEAFDLAAEMPMIVRGFYFEGWDRAGNPTRERTRDAFLGKVGERLAQMPDVDPWKLTRAVFGVLARHVSAGELSDVQGMLPEEIRELWPAAVEGVAEDRRTPRAAANEGRAAARRAKQRIARVLAEARAEGARPGDLPLMVSRETLPKRAARRRR